MCYISEERTRKGCICSSTTGSDVRSHIVEQKRKGDHESTEQKGSNLLSTPELLPPPIDVKSLPFHCSNADMKKPDTLVGGGRLPLFQLVTVTQCWQLKGPIAQHLVQICLEIGHDPSCCAHKGDSRPCPQSLEKITGLLIRISATSKVTENACDKGCFAELFLKIINFIVAGFDVQVLEHTFVFWLANILWLMG